MLLHARLVLTDPIVVHSLGKTTTMVEMVTVAATAENRYTVLVTAPSNTAVANIALKLFATGRFHHGEVVVFGENCDPSVHFLSPKQRGRKFALLCKERETYADPDIRERLRQEFVRWLQCAGDETFSMPALASMCPVITDDETGRKTAKEILSSTRIVCSTLNSAGSGFLRSALDVRTLMLDEAGQAHEAEFYIATSYPGLKRIILVGDPQQLPATVISPPCKAAGLGKSWLEKVQHVDADALHLLDMQYRMDPNILAFPNKTFYRGRIKTGDKVLDRDQLVRAPFLFVDTARRGKEEKEDFSFRNAYEATVIKSLITTDKDIRRIIHNDGSARIMVIAPYRAQVKLLMAILSTLRLSSLDVGTVDSCQGQEAEIVIVSTVRTKSAGFVDSPARLNVALTRAKMVLRVVGDATFFGGLVSSSTLRRLCAHAEVHNVIEATNIRSDPWSAPAWHQEMVWLPIANTRFCTRIQELSARDKNLCLNTLFAVAKPDPVALGGHIPNKKEPGWYLSYLKINRGLLCIVWVAKEGATKPIAEAHFAGSRDECLRFTQMNSTAPFGSRFAQKDMSGLRPLVETDGRSDLCGRIGQQPLVAWPVTDSIQKAILSNTALPDGIVQLDPYQERVARSPPPLLIESRSGTGKTLVLLQHVAYHSSRTDEGPACFLTVSPRLCRQLKQKYDEMQALENQTLPPVHFYAFHSFLDQLLSYARISDFTQSSKCRFEAFDQSRTSHKQLNVDPTLVENEIGGVIMGSLEAADLCRPMSRESYLSTKRSNVENKSQSGLGTRSEIYDIYEKYHDWKKRNDRYDINDAVLRLLEWQHQNQNEIFSSGTLSQIITFESWLMLEALNRCNVYLQLQAISTKYRISVMRRSFLFANWQVGAISNGYAQATLLK
jgi:hypothetical protein